MIGSILISDWKLANDATLLLSLFWINKSVLGSPYFLTASFFFGIYRIHSPVSFLYGDPSAFNSLLIFINARASLYLI